MLGLNVEPAGFQRDRGVVGKLGHDRDVARGELTRGSLGDAQDSDHRVAKAHRRCGTGEHAGLDGRERRGAAGSRSGAKPGLRRGPGAGRKEGEIGATQLTRTVRDPLQHHVLVERRGDIARHRLERERFAALAIGFRETARILERGRGGPRQRLGQRKVLGTVASFRTRRSEK